jgi:hypothetical protein
MHVCTAVSGGQHYTHMLARTLRKRNILTQHAHHISAQQHITSARTHTCTLTHTHAHARTHAHTTKRKLLSIQRERPCLYPCFFRSVPNCASAIVVLLYTCYQSSLQAGFRHVLAPFAKNLGHIYTYIYIYIHIHIHIYTHMQTHLHILTTSFLFRLYTS